MSANAGERRGTLSGVPLLFMPDIAEHASENVYRVDSHPCSRIIELRGVSLRLATPSRR